MAKEYVYTNIKNGKVIFRTVEANYVSKDTIDQKVKEKTGLDPRLDRHIVECQIRAVQEPVTKMVGRYDKNKRLS